MPEAVRLVVWDLDETFWKGTLTEGGIREYVQEHHDIVIELARRGIMSSICSKNDEAAVLTILNEKNILDHFIFPSITWAPKGQRLAALVETVQLRPATVMFIDDNPNNRAEALAVVPDLQVEDETFISRMLSDPRFKGKDDTKLTRLAQYKLLETRKKDQERASGDNAEFLRGCDVRVYVEYDILSHIDRAIELINRTNQLNFTKKRLPEDPEEARRNLADEVRRFSCRAGLVRVVDKYGDYGFVGFYLVKNGRAELSEDVAADTLVHYCFSCRTLGMLVEQWFYDWLRRPELTVVGEVLTDLTVPRTIDWIRMVPSLSESAAATPQLAPEIRILGGCEANAVAHYLGAHCKTVTVTGNFAAGSLFVRLNSASLLLSACDHSGPDFEREATTLGLPFALMGGAYFRNPPEGTAFIFSGGMDAGLVPRYRHKERGWEIKIEINGLPALNFVSSSDEEIEKIEGMKFPASTREQVLSVVRHLRQNYDVVRRGGRHDELSELMCLLFDRVPVGSKFVVILDDERIRQADGVIKAFPWIAQYNEGIKSIAASFPYVGVLSSSDFIRSEDELQVNGNHYDRMVYCRLADEIAETLRRLPAKAAAAAGVRPLSSAAIADVAQDQPQRPADQRVGAI